MAHERGDVHAFTARAFERIGAHAGVRIDAEVRDDAVRLSFTAARSGDR